MFAGEDIEATITFTNIAQPAPSPRSLSRFTEPNWDAPSRAVSSYSGAERARKNGPNAAQRPGLARHASLNDKRGIKGHRQTMSVSTVNNGAGVAAGRAVSGPSGPVQPMQTTATARPKHGRTLSILSLATDVTEQRGSVIEQRAMRGHGRAASVQVPGRKASEHQLSGMDRASENGFTD